MLARVLGEDYAAHEWAEDSSREDVMVELSEDRSDEQTLGGHGDVVEFCQDGHRKGGLGSRVAREEQSELILWCNFERASTCVHAVV